MGEKKLQKYIYYAKGFALGQRDYAAGAEINACGLPWNDERRRGCELLPKDPRCRGWRKGWKFEARKQNGENWRVVLREKRERELREAKLARPYVPSLQKSLLQIHRNR